MVRGEWVRHAPHRSSLLGRASVVTDGRWQLAAVTGGLYLADDRETAVAEWYRYLAERGLPPTYAVPHDHHVWRVELEVANLRDPERLARVGLGPPLPTQRTWPAFQEIGDALFNEGWSGLVAPSAARPRHVVACIFTTSWPPAGCTPLRTIEIAEIPTPPRGLTT
jgi:RES domain